MFRSSKSRNHRISSYSFNDLQTVTATPLSIFSSDLSGEILSPQSIRLLIHLALVSKLSFFLKMIFLVLSLWDGFERPSIYTGYCSTLKSQEYSPNRLQVLWYQQRFKSNIKSFSVLTFNYPAETFSSNNTPFN